jgi:hypothetical protein
MAHQSFLPGNDLFAATAAPDGRYGAFFDDDGESAYFYALDLDSDDLILDAIHVYDAASFPNRKRHASLSIIWSPDGHQCALKCSVVFPAPVSLLRSARTAAAGPSRIIPGPTPPSRGSISENPPERAWLVESSQNTVFPGGSIGRGASVSSSQPSLKRPILRSLSGTPRNCE